MTFQKALILIAGGLLIAGTAVAQPPVDAAGVAGNAAFAAPEGGAMVLYDQTDNDGGNGAPDQDFEASFDAYDSEGADDFDVTWPDGWDLSQINTVGTTGTSGGALVDVNIYTDNGGTPLGGAIICSYDDVPPTADVTGSLTVDLPTICSVPTGLHWLAIQVNQNFGTFGQHFWSNRSVQSFAPAHWRNPGNGFASGCIDWTMMMGVNDGNPATGCGVGGGVNPDFLYNVVGTLGEPMNPTVDVPTLGQFGLLALLLSLVGAGVYRLRRKNS